MSSKTITLPIDTSDRIIQIWHDMGFDIVFLI